MLREFVLFCEQHDDRARIERALRALHEAYPADVDCERPGGGFLASRWYPAELVHVLVDAVIAGRDEADQTALAARAAGAIMGRTLSGVYRLVFSTFATPELYARHAGKLWALHYDNGSLQTAIERRDRTHAVAHTRVTRWLGHHPFICMLNGAAGKPIYEAMGCRDVRSETVACVARGADHCAWLTHWSADE